MKSVREFIGQPLVLKEEKCFELRGGDEVLGLLHRQKDGRSTVELAEGSWSFKQDGFWHPQLRIEENGRHFGAQLLFNRGTRLVLSFPVERLFLCTSSHNSPILGSPKAQALWLSAERQEIRHKNKQVVQFKARGAPLVRFQGKASSWSGRVSGTVLIDSSAASIQELPLLVALGWYRLLQALGVAQLAGSLAAVGGQ